MAINLIKEPAPPKGKLKLPDLYATAVGQVIGAGVVTLIVPAMGMTGNSAWLAYLVAVLVGFLYVLPCVFACSALRFGGGTYSVSCDLLGPRLGGVFAFSYLAGPLYMSMFALSAVTYIGDVFPVLSSPVGRIASALIIATLFFIFTIRGMNVMAAVQKIMVWILIAALAMYIIFGLVHMQYPIFDFNDPNFMPQGMLKFDGTMLTGGFLTAVFLFYSSTTGYGMNLGYGRDAANARRDVPKSMLLTFPTILVLYVGVAIATAGSTSLEDFAGSSSLVYSARRIMPPILAYLFIIGGPVMAVLSSFNSSFAYHSLTLGQSCRDGWFPKKFGERNKYGTYTYILIFIYLLSVLPIIFGIDITQLVNLLQLVTFLTTILPQIAFLNLPKKYPEAWKNAKLRVPLGIYYLSCWASIIVSTVVFIKSCLSMNILVVVVSLVFIAACVILGLWRTNGGHVTIRTSVWDSDGDE